MDVVTPKSAAESDVGEFPLSAETWRHVQDELDLPPQQIEYVRLLLGGHDGQQIAEAMGISYATLRTYTVRLQQKTNTRGQLDLLLRILRIVDRFGGDRIAACDECGSI